MKKSGSDTCSNYFYLPSRRLEDWWGESAPCVMNYDIDIAVDEVFQLFLL
jgi:hypothetical protein